MADLIVQAWHTECGECRYGSGGWAASPARDDKPILTPESRTCHGCGVAFTRVVNPYAGTTTVLPKAA